MDIEKHDQIYSFSLKRDIHNLKKNLKNVLFKF